MTVGDWLTEAQRGLFAATDAIGGSSRPASSDIDAVIAARSAIYRHLGRMIEILNGERPASADHPPLASLPDDSPRRRIIVLYTGLLAAGGVEQRAAPQRPTRAARPLQRAADAIGVAADILASHATPGQQSRTAEGAALRAGGGVPGALATVSRLTLAAIDFDYRLPAWISPGPASTSEARQQAVGAARAVTSGQLAVVAQEVADAGHDQPSLIEELDFARLPLNPPPAVSTIGDAATALAAAGMWLRQNPGQVAVAHLQLATQIGLAVHTLIAPPDSPPRQQWRVAARAAADLRGIPPTGLARDAAAELAEVLRFTRTLLDPGQGERRKTDRQMARISAQLPDVAAALHRGMLSPPVRNTLLVPEAVLRRTAGSLIYHASRQWRLASLVDEPLRDLSSSLGKLRAGQREPAAGRVPRSVAAAAFPQLPQPMSSRVGAASPARPSTPRPSRGRSG